MGEDQQTEFDSDFEPLVQLLMSKKGLKVKSAAEVGARMVNFFRGKDLKKFFQDEASEPLLKRKGMAAFKSCFGEERLPEDEAEIAQLGQAMISKGFISHATYAPVGGSSDSDKKKAWPDRLVRTTKGFDPDAYYILNYEGSKLYQHVMLGLMVFGLLLCCLWRVWPMWAKVAVWYFTVALSTLFVIIIIVRLIFYALLWIVGCEFWILPNFLDDSLGVMESFVPGYSFEKRADGPFMLVVRFFALGVFVSGGYQVSQTTSLSDFTEFSTMAMADLIEWGEQNLLALPSHESNVPSLEDLSKAVEADEASDGEDDDDDDVAEEKKEDAKANYAKDEM